MQRNNLLTQLTLSSSFALLSFGLMACTTPSATNQASSEAQSEVAAGHGANHGAEMPMSEGMDHDGMHMSLGPQDELFDLRFIDAMIPHHEGAVVMAQEALEKSDREEIQTLSQEIIAAQEQEIQQLQEWRQAWYPDADETPVMYHESMGHTMPMTEEMRQSMMMSGDLGEADAEFDLRFINAMIPHHEGAVVMAQEALENSDREEVRQLAQAIIDAQQQEIEQMEQWRQDWYE
ncbi:DUF305 domain-containing protein [filamentous cyanobacterium CCP1]|nr:DUF305 domain-containing protein [filamentous cyanobacterium CCP2]PSB54635.1 DUF305 domain-containing protein [filamentous cyanobacterium CCP1]